MKITEKNHKQIKIEIKEKLACKNAMSADTQRLSIQEIYDLTRMTIQQKEYRTPCEVCHNMECTDLNRLFWCRYFEA